MKPTLQHLMLLEHLPHARHLRGASATKALVIDGAPMTLWAALARATVMALALTLTGFSHAGPGAHGPNGEHLDAPTTARPASALPRLQAHTDAFELVAELRATELVILVDRYESNEPVLSAKLEVESGALKAVATFRPEQGDYVVTEPALLKALNSPGEHALVFTLLAGSASDLLDGTLTRQAENAGATGQSAPRSGLARQERANDHPHDHPHDHDLERAAWVGASIAALGLLGGLGWWRQRRKNSLKNSLNNTQLLQGGP